MEVGLRKKFPSAQILNKLLFTKRLKMEAHLNGSLFDQEELIKSARAKMGEVREENERLKNKLTKIVKDYESLEKKVSSMVRSQSSIDSSLNDDDKEDNNHELVSLSLGGWTSNNKKYGETSKRRKLDGRLELGLKYKLSDICSTATTDTRTASNSKKSTILESGDEETKEKENKMVNENKNSKEKEEVILHPLPQVKKTRVCIRSRCETPTMNDGCQWRKYGQKIAKGNPCPRAYYRCTVSPSCPVRKQVQRCASDMSILITTYEGTHNHPLPLAATTIASATTAAASMLKTGSLPSSSHNSHNSSFVSHFNPNSRISITNPSMISSSHNSHPTVTLDLTTPNSDLAPFNWLLPSSSSSRNDSSNFLNFSSSSPSISSTTSLDFTTKPASVSAWGGGYLNYATLYPYNFNTNNTSQMHGNRQPTLNETIAAVATKAITTNPNFQSVLAAAISSYVENNVASTTTTTTTDNQGKQSLPPSSNAQTQSNKNKNLSLFPALASNNNSSASQ